MLFIHLFFIFLFEAVCSLEQTTNMNETAAKDKKSSYISSENQKIHSSESGLCGDNLKYIFESNTLNITGTGPMYNFTTNNQPWNDFKLSIFSIMIHDNATSIGNNAFIGCTNLIEIIFRLYNDCMIYIGKSSFENCSSLTSISIPYYVRFVESSAFSQCTSLELAKLPFIAKIEPYTFYNCSSLKSIEITDNVHSIGDFSFSWCTSLSSIRFVGPRVTEICDNAFSYCTNLTTIKIPNVTLISSFAFAYCSKLQSVYFSEGVSEISSHAFFQCTSLYSIRISEDMTKIGSYAFADCSNLSSIVVKSKVNFIGEHAFDNCKELNNFQYQGEIEASCGSDFLAGTKVDTVTVTDVYKNDTFCDMPINKLVATNFFTISNLPPVYALMRVGIFFFPLLLP